MRTIARYQFDIKKTKISQTYKFMMISLAGENETHSLINLGTGKIHYLNFDSSLIFNFTFNNQETQLYVQTGMDLYKYDLITNGTQAVSTELPQIQFKYQRISKDDKYMFIMVKNSLYKLNLRSKQLSSVTIF